MATSNFFPVFVNHISEQVTPSDLRVLFSRYGPVGEVVIVSSYGFVNMLDELASLEVVSKLNGRALYDKLLHVDFSEELKYHMRRKGVLFHPTTDPMTGLTVREHPACPTGQGITSPFPELSGSGDFKSLLEDKALLDERLKKVNEELKFVKSTGLIGPEERRRSRSRSRGRLNVRERGGRSSDRERRHGERREGLPPRRRSSPSRKVSPRNRLSPSRRPLHERKQSPGRRPPQFGRRSPGRRQSPGRRYFDGRRQIAEGPRPKSEGPRKRQSPHRGQHFPKRGMGSRGRPPPRSRERSPIHARISPQREPSPNREMGLVLGGRAVSPIRGKVIVDVDNDAEEAGEARRRFEDFDQLESWEANRHVEESPALEPPEPDLRTVLTNRRTTRQPSDEFEDSVDIDLSKKNMKIQINIDTKDLNNIDRKIVVDEDAEPVDVYELHIEGVTKKMFPQDLYSLFGDFGTVLKAELIRDYAFVDIETTEKMALKAVDKLDGETHFGNTLSVEFKRGKKQDHLRNRDENTECITLSSPEAMDNQTKPFTAPNIFRKGTPSSIFPGNTSDEITTFQSRQSHAGTSWEAATSSRNSAPGKPADSFTASFHSLPKPVATQAPKEQSFEGLLDTFVKATREESNHQMQKDTKAAKGWSDWIKKPDNQDSDSSVIFDGYSNMGNVIQPANPNEAQTSTQLNYLDTKQPSTQQSYLDAKPICTQQGYFDTKPTLTRQSFFEANPTSTQQSYLDAKPTSTQQGYLDVKQISTQQGFLETKNKIGLQEPEISHGPGDPGPKAIRKFYVAGLKSYINDFDLKDLFGRYGQVNRVDSKITFSLVNIYCTELSAVQCICELNGHLIKGSRLRINFMKGSYEETKDFKEKWKKEFKLYSSTSYKKSLDSVTQLPERMSLSQIGEGLKNFDMTLSIAPVHPSFQQPPPVSNPTLPSSNSSFQSIDTTPFSSSTTYATAYPTETKQQSHAFGQSEGGSVNDFPPLTQMPPCTATSSNQFSQTSSSQYQTPTNQYQPPASTFQQLPSKFQMTNSLQAPPAQSAPPAAFQSTLPLMSFPPPVMASASYLNQPQLRLNFPSRHPENSTDDNVAVLNAVQGTIHSMQNKMILLEFTSGNNNVTKFAKLIPGQMFINGQTCLGVVIKSNTFHTWPKIVKDFLQIGKKVWMDVKRLSEKEMHEGKDREFKVGWTAPIAWQGGIGNKPTEDQITLNKSNSSTNIVTASVVKLFPSWGILRHKDYDIIFRVQNLYWDGAILKENMSLLTNCDLEIGDIVAVHCKKTDTIQELGGEDASSVKYEALMVWQVSAEVDPWVYFPKPQMTCCDFLITSSTLNRQLPGEKEAEFKGLQGTVEEIHLPAGGIVKLDLKTIPTGVVPSNCAPNHERVYFHRSRVYLNGTKVQSDQSLDAELKIGDQVTVDVVRNLMDQNDPPYVMSGAHWVALSLRANTVVRGVSLAAQLRQECEDDLEDLGPNVATGRVVYLAPPAEPKGAVVSGVAVIDSGDFLGQRVQFDRTVCSAFGFPLAKADLSYVFSQGEKVYIEVKPYNSYCVEKLWTGFSKSAYKEQGLDMNERTVMKMYLSDHGMNTTNFDLLIKGEFSPRLYIPLQRQHFRGRIVSLQEDNEGVAIGAIIEGPTGELVRAKRSVIHVYGQWMGKADLHYCMQGQEVLYEMLPRYSEGLEEHTVGLVWVGNEDARPRHPAETNLYWSSSMNNSLKIWLGGKKMDLHIFKALIDGMLPSKRKSMESGNGGPSSEEKLDPEILAQATMLQKMKSKQFNPAAMMQAIMTMMGGTGGPSETTKYVGQGGTEAANSLGSLDRGNSENVFNPNTANKTDFSSASVVYSSGETNSMRYSGTHGEYGTIGTIGPGKRSFPSPGVSEEGKVYSGNTQSGYGANQCGSIGTTVQRNPIYSLANEGDGQVGGGNTQLCGSGNGNSNYSQFQAHSGYSTAALKAAGIISDQSTGYSRSTVVSQGYAPGGATRGQGSSLGYFTGQQGGSGYFTHGSPGYSTEKKY